MRCGHVPRGAIVMYRECRRGCNPRVAQVVTRDYLDAMRTVGIKQLKARLSEYVRAVKQGETFLVTDRDAVVAELRPPGSPLHTNTHRNSADAILADAAAAGEVTMAASTKVGWRWEPTGIGLSRETASRLISDLRDDRESVD
jgi:antitoxin (DNA-binding transcriptional repressor) of toxin-antitoxin stability system